MKTRLLRIAAASILAIAVSAGIAWWQVRSATTTVESGTKSAVPIGGPFTLTDQLGKTVTDADFRGKYMLIYFGYTYCPDVCPTELGVMTQALDQLGPKAEQVRLVDIFFAGLRMPLLGVTEELVWETPAQFFEVFANAGALFNHTWQMVGRDDALATLNAFLSDTAARLVFLTGAGGSGKSRV